MYEKTILCLANSQKPPSGRCIAGKEVSGTDVGKWIRPVSARPSREVSETERRYENGRKAKPLDIISIAFARHEPQGHQVENHVLDEDYYWEKEGEASWAQVQAAADPIDPKFWSASESTYYGLHDKISPIVAGSHYTSLQLITLPRLAIEVRSEPGYEGRPARKRVRGRFQVGGLQYLLSVTDPVVEETYLARDLGEYSIDRVAMCVSLTEIWNGYAFRVIASVITADRCRS